jgi:hypothetical protein
VGQAERIYQHCLGSLGSFVTQLQDGARREAITPTTNCVQEFDYPDELTVFKCLKLSQGLGKALPCQPFIEQRGEVELKLSNSALLRLH